MVKRSHLTIIIEDTFGFLIFSGINEHSYKGVHNGHQQDDEEHDLCLFEQNNKNVFRKLLNGSLPHL